MNKNTLFGWSVCFAGLLCLVWTLPTFGQWAKARGRFLNQVKILKNIEYAQVDGQSLKLDLYLPKESEVPPPLLVWIHGGGWVHGSKKHVKLSVLKLALEGYAVASIDYRLEDITSHPKQIHDCKGAIRWLRAKADTYGYNATRIGAGGGSAGGHLVLLLGLSGDDKSLEGTVGGNLDQSSRIQAIVDFYGPSDFERLANQNNRFKKRFQDNTDPQSLIKSASPLTYLSKDDPPLLIFHGDQDPVVPLDQSQRIHEQYQKARLQSTLNIIKGAGHGGRAFADQTRSDMVKIFFDRHIKQIKAVE